jgi:hypothetical protein
MHAALCCPPSDSSRRRQVADSDVATMLTLAATTMQVEGGSKGEGRAAPMSENKQAQNNVENMAAPDGDRVLEGGFPTLLSMLRCVLCGSGPAHQ